MDLVMNQFVFDASFAPAGWGWGFYLSQIMMIMMWLADWPPIHVVFSPMVWRSVDIWSKRLSSAWTAFTGGGRDTTLWKGAVGACFGGCDAGNSVFSVQLSGNDNESPLFLSREDREGTKAIENYGFSHPKLGAFLRRTVGWRPQPLKRIGVLGVRSCLLPDTPPRQICNLMVDPVHKPPPVYLLACDLPFDMKADYTDCQYITCKLL